MSKKIPKLKRILFAVEGTSEASFIAFLARLEGAKTTPTIENLGGSSNTSMLEKAIKISLRKELREGKFSRKVLLIDSDRLGKDGNLLEEPLKQKCENAHFELILMRPNFEGLILKLYEEFYNKDVRNLDTFSSLRKLWTNYEKAADANTYYKKFSKEKLFKSSEICAELSTLLHLFGHLPT